MYTYINIYIYIGWWFQPLWKILASWDYYSHIYIYIYGKNKTCSKPPTRYVILYMVKNSFCFDRSLIALHISSSTESDVTMYCAPAMWRSVLRQNISDRLTRGLFPQGFAGEMSIFSFFVVGKSQEISDAWCDLMFFHDMWWELMLTCWHVDSTISTETTSQVQYRRKAPL